MSSRPSGSHSDLRASAEAPFDWQDPLYLNAGLSDEERLTSAAAHAFCQTKLMPRSRDAHRHEHFDRAVMSEFGEHGLLGATVPERWRVR